MADQLPPLPGTPAMAAPVPSPLSPAGNPAPAPAVVPIVPTLVAKPAAVAVEAAAQTPPPSVQAAPPPSAQPAAAAPAAVVPATDPIPTPVPATVSKPVPKPMPKPAPVAKSAPAAVEPTAQKVVVEKANLVSRPRITCRTISCGGCLLIIFLIAAAVGLFITRPGWFKSWANNGIQPPEQQGTTYDGAKARVKQQLTAFKVGENELTMTQDQVRAFLAHELSPDNFESLHLELGHGVIRMYIDLDRGSEDPLWGIAELMFDDEKEPYISRLGLEKVHMPQFVNTAVTKFVLTVSGYSAEGARSVIESLLSLPDNATVTDVRILPGQMIVVIEVTTGLEKVFNN